MFLVSLLLSLTSSVSALSNMDQILPVVPAKWIIAISANELEKNILQEVFLKIRLRRQDVIFLGGLTSRVWLYPFWRVWPRIKTFIKINWMWCFDCDTCYHISGSNEYGWWFSSEKDTYDPLIPTDVTKGFGDSLEVVKTTFNDKVQSCLLFY